MLLRSMGALCAFLSHLDLATVFTKVSECSLHFYKPKQGSPERLSDFSKVAQLKGEAGENTQKSFLTVRAFVLPSLA